MMKDFIIQYIFFSLDFIVQQLTMRNNKHQWHVIYAELSSWLKTMRTVNDDGDQTIMKKLTTLDLNITFHEDNSLLNQLISIPVIGKTKHNLKI